MSKWIVPPKRLIEPIFIQEVTVDDFYIEGIAGGFRIWGAGEQMMVETPDAGTVQAVISKMRCTPMSALALFNVLDVALAGRLPNGPFTPRLVK